MKSNTRLLAPLLILAFAGGASAATIVWDSPVTIAGSDDVNTEGTQVFGRCIAVATGTSGIVNGVDFGYANAWGTTYSETFPGTNFTSDSTSAGLGGADATDYGTVLNVTRYAGGTNTSATFTLGNLTIGDDYLFQFWVADYRPFGNNRTETIAGTGTNISMPTLKFLDSDLSNTPGAAHGQYVIARFEADATSLVFTVTGNEGPNYSAMQLRNVTVPEPGAALIGSIGVMALLRRRRI